VVTETAGQLYRNRCETKAYNLPAHADPTGIDFKKLPGLQAAAAVGMQRIFSGRDRLLA
jgi:hypothetical protein